MTKIPRQKFNYGAPSTEGDIPPLEITDVQPLIDHIRAIKEHLQEAWEPIERDLALQVINKALVAIVDFRALDAAHRDGVLSERPGHGLWAG